ncbi:terminase gpA endonuclease subunit [Thiospirillum jenense]|uniref:terminase gpA endonuclease subunit n=1 Tax=Thiospirillum jenense TaxID=1653858 RepID=UPI0015F8450C
MKTTLQNTIRRGLSVLKQPLPLKLSEWAERNFYLSTESSYVEGRWEAYPYQVGIMNCISNDDIKEITVIKSARVGFTKILLAAIGYFAEHKRRNQAVWQPVDADADEFVKTEIDTMIRDIPVMRAIFPSYNQKSKHNTLRQKTFLGSVLHIRGGKSAKNYRRLSLDAAYLDELDGFDEVVEQEGTPDGLAVKRLEGASFPKLVCGSTPTIAETSLIQRRANQVNMFMRYHIPCPHCGQTQPLEFGDKDSQFGFKWKQNQPHTVQYQCIHCGQLFNQNDYLTTWHDGRWETDNGEYFNIDIQFFNRDNQSIAPPRSIGFHIWTAYSPQLTWSDMIDDWLRRKGDPIKLREFVNTTLGESWREKTEKTDPQLLLTRRENYTQSSIPSRVLYLTAAADIQDNRVEVEIEGWRKDGRDKPLESWGINYIVLNGDPAKSAVWQDLDKILLSDYHTEDGRVLRIKAACIDSGGHFAAQVYSFCESRRGRNIYAVKGVSGSRPIWTQKSSQSKKYQAQLWLVGVDAAKETVYSRLKIHEQGPGYCHFPVHYNEHYFNGLTSEQVRTKYVKGKPVREWFLPPGKRNEPLDIRAYNLAALLSRPVNWSQLVQTGGGFNNTEWSTAPKAVIRKRESHW